uniref:uncharacterized protein n=1 Tax=Pristiophorus japonicus TaxID=55135 RepID=UPI00398EBC4C
MEEVTQHAVETEDAGESSEVGEEQLGGCKRARRISDEKKLWKNRAEQRQTGGGSPVIIELTDIEEWVLTLVGSHPRSAMHAAAEPDVMPPQPVVQLHATPPSPEAGGLGPDSPDDCASGAEEPRFSPVELQGTFSTDDSADFEEPASPSYIMQSTPMTSGAPAAILSSTMEVPGPSTLPQGTRDVSRTAPITRRLVRRSRSAPRAADLSVDMVDLSRRSVDVGQQLLQTMGGISHQLTSMSATMSEYVPQMAEALKVIARSTGGRGTAPPLPTTHESQEEDLASGSEHVPTLGLSSPVSIQLAVLSSSLHRPPPPPPVSMKQRLRSSSARWLGVRRGRGRGGKEKRGEKGK